MTAMVSDEEMERTILACDELIRLCRAQRDAIEVDDVDQLNDLIERRADLLSSLDLDAFVPKVRNPLLSATPAPVAVGQSVIVEKLRELLRIDEENQRVLRARLAGIKAQLASVSQGRRTLNEYAYLNPSARPVFIDKLR